MNGDAPELAGSICISTPILSDLVFRAMTNHSNISEHPPSGGDLVDTVLHIAKDVAKLA